MRKKTLPKQSTKSPQPSLKVSPLPFGARLLSAEDVIKLGVSKRDLGGIHNSGRLEPLLIKEVTNASLRSTADELRSLADDLNHYNYSDPWVIERASRLSLGPFAELYCDLHKAKNDQQKEMKSIVYQIMGLLRDITRRRYSKTCADDLRHWADRLAKPIPPETSGGELSKPMTKSAMKNALRIDGYKAFNTFAKKHSIQQAGNRQLWQIRLDTMDEATRKKLEKA